MNERLESQFENFSGSDKKTEALLLSAVLEQSQEAFLTAIYHVAKSKGLTHFAEQAGTSRYSLYRYGKNAKNPKFSVVCSLVAAMGFKLAVVPR